MTKHSTISDPESVASGPSDYLSPGEAARLLGVSAGRVHQLDNVLCPIRTETGRRFYARAKVERLRQERLAAKTKSPDAE